MGQNFLELNWTREEGEDGCCINLKSKCDQCGLVTERAFSNVTTLNKPAVEVGGCWTFKQIGQLADGEWLILKMIFSMTRI